MTNILLLASTVLLWGTTWIAIAFQIEAAPVPVLVSIFHRFALAALVMVAGLALMGRLHKPRVWRFVFAQALCLFCCNFIALYTATTLIPSGLVSVIFSLASLFNAVNARIFFGDKITSRTLLAAALGATGLLLLFWHDLTVDFDISVLKGMGWAALGTCFFSLGNMASRRNTAEGVPPVTANAWGMSFGAMALLGIIYATGNTPTLPVSLDYWLAAGYLAVFGSVAGFTAYLMLVARIGSARAGYATVLFPIIALAASSLFEGYQWTPEAIAGLALTGLGNLVMFTKFSLRPARAMA
jgi:drug/metabolite transporter (DMT)-like permease